MWPVHLALFTVALIYAAVFSIAREVMQYIPPFGFIVLRVGISLGLFLLLYIFFIRNKTFDRKDLRRILACGIFGVGANMLLFFKGLSLTLPINGAILMTNTPVFVVILAALFRLEKLTIHKGLGVLIASIGATLLLAGDQFNFSGDTLLGDIMVTINAIIYSFYLIHAKPLLHKYPPVAVSVFTFSVGFLFTLPFGIGDLSQARWDDMNAQLVRDGLWGSIWLKTFFIIIFASFVTYLLNAWSLKKGSSSLVGSYIYLQPVLAALIAEMAGKDHITIPKFLEMLLIFAGVYLVSKRKKEEAT